MFYMPRERRDIATTKVIAEKANWSNEEVLIQLDYQDKKDQEEDNRLDAEYQANGNRFIENGPRAIWGRVIDEVARDSEQYIL